MKINSAREIEIGINQGDIQLDYNVNLNLQVLIIGDGLNYDVFYLVKGVLVKKFKMGFNSKNPYYSAKDLAAQYPHLETEFKL